MANKCAFFLGANTPKGFVSLFSELYNPYKDTNAYIIKGGPGCGKSTYMKKIAKEHIKKGYFTELIYCSSDPDSLDGVIVKEKNFSVADGTSPHLLEPKFPGCAENIINLGAFWDEKKLKEKAKEIKSLSIECSLYHRRSSGYLSAAGKLDGQNRAIASEYINREKIDSFATRFINRELPKKKNSPSGIRHRRFLSGITPKGIVFFKGTVEALCTRIIGIEDSYGISSVLLTERIAEGAIKNGYDVYFCHCPMHPDEAEHILIPEKNLSLIRLHSAEKDISCSRIIHSSRFMLEGIKEHKSLICFNEKIKNELIRESIKNLRLAKQTHDKLEKYYIDAMDFEKLNTL